MSALDFTGTERFEVRRRLGAGAFGAVYEVYDRVRDERVALKTLLHLEPADIYEFKREFRALADVTHPNLAALHELVSAGDVWFFTMELVPGLSFLEHVRPPATGLDLGRLRPALRQLAEGVVALHDAGKLHRDIKPTNVLVTEAGRVVLLDFGLVTELEPCGPHASTAAHLIGTVAYMSPEQAANRPLAAASDWYSVGAMLHEALAGTLPFGGPAVRVLAAKQEREPPPPSRLAPGIPDDLDRLCADLLRRDPAARPDGREVLRRLAGAPANAPALAVGPAVTPAVAIEAGPRPAPPLPLVGRTRQLAALRDAFEATRRGRPVTAHVHGRSGMGKTALVREFTDGLVERGEAACLAGRCYERESVPYKALDSLVDSLSRHLKRVPSPEAVLPRDIHALARLFPVLGRVEAVARAPRRGLETPDPQERRRHAFAALRGLLARLADRAPLVLLIDDLQWGDIDSAALLADLLRPPDPPVLLLLACYRTEEAETSPVLQALPRPRARVEAAGAAADAEAGADVREVVLGPLSRTEARDLARELLGEDDGGDLSPDDLAMVADTVARESAGNPFFVGELVQYLRQGPGPSAEVTLDGVIRARLRRLPEDARRLLEVVAVAGRPLPPAIAARAVDLGGALERAAVAALRAAHLVLSRQAGEGEAIEAYHDRIREAAVASLPAARLAECHRRLATALEASGRADPEALTVHLLGAGERERAGEHAAAAAEGAAAALAFDRAVELYRLALELKPWPAEAACRLRARLGDALASAGRGADAARSYLEAAAGAGAAPALDLERRAADQLLRSGHVDEGIALIGRVLDALGLKLAPTPRRALLSLLVRRAYVRLRGLAFRERDAAAIEPAELARIDTCWSVAIGLGIVDPIRGADFQARHLLLALRAGEPYRVARGVAAEVGYAATRGGRARRRIARLRAAAEALAARAGAPHAIGFSRLSAGTAAFFLGEFRRALDVCREAEAILRERCAGVAWEVATAQLFLLWSLYYLGEVADLRARVQSLLDEAEARGDRYAATSLRIGLMSTRWLAADDPDGARRDVEEAMRSWSERGFHLQHSNDLLGRAQIDLYAGDAAGARRRIEEAWPALEGSLLLRVQHIDVVMRHLRARCALAAAAGGGAGAASLLAAAGREARAIERERMAWSDPLARLVLAGIAAVRGDPATTAAALAAAAEGFDAAGMGLYAAAARRRHGQVQGGDEGRARVAAADAWMSARDVRRPARMAAMLAPGFPEAT